MGYARALLGMAIANPAEARTLLAEAAAVIDRLPPEYRRLRMVTNVRGWITEEAAKRR